MTKNKITHMLAGAGTLLFIILLIIGMVILAEYTAFPPEEGKVSGNNNEIRLALGIIGGCMALTFSVFFWERARCYKIYLDNRRIHALMEASSSLIFMYDMKTGETDWQGDAEHIFQVKKRGLTAEEMVHPDDWPFVMQQIEDLKRNKIYSLDIRILDAEGRYHSCSILMTSVRNASGRITCVLGTIHNVGEKKEQNQNSTEN